MQLSEILKEIRYKSACNASRVEISKVTCDSRSVSRGDLFIAYRGYPADGFNYINEAIAKGASAVLAERDFDPPAGIHKILVKDTRSALPIIAANYHRSPSSALSLIGITGTNGKTTVTYVIERILSAAGIDSGVIGTINYRYKDIEIPAKNTTPGPLELQSILADMVKSRVRYAVMEVSSHSLDQGRVNGILFDSVIFTNITSDHLDYHETISEYFNAKKKIFGRMKLCGTAILNNDDKKVRLLKGSIRGKVLTYGIGEGADIRVRGLNMGLDGSSFEMVTPAGSAEVRTSLIGRHNVSNILAGAAACLAEGVELRWIVEGLRSLEPAPGRLEPIIVGQPFKVFVDFAHTQDALQNILGFFREVAGRGKIVTVFGCGGDRDKTKRPLMGTTVCALSDRVFLTSDNPRFEKPCNIIKDIERGLKGEFSNYVVVEDRRRAICEALKCAAAGDIVIIAGKGHEKYQIVKDKRSPFDDCQVARHALRMMCKGGGKREACEDKRDNKRHKR